VVRGDRVFARSASDDKAPIVAMLTALDAMFASHVKPSVNLKFVFEGEEEAGSPHLSEYLDRFADDLRADANRLAHGQPKHRRKLDAAQQAKASRDLDLHRIDKGDGR